MMCCACKAEGNGVIYSWRKFESIKLITSSNTLYYIIHPHLIYQASTQETISATKMTTLMCPMIGNKTCANIDKTTFSYEKSTVKVIERTTGSEKGIETSYMTQESITSDTTGNS